MKLKVPGYLTELVGPPRQDRSSSLANADLGLRTPWHLFLYRHVLVGCVVLVGLLEEPDLQIFFFDQAGATADELGFEDRLQCTLHLIDIGELLYVYFGVRDTESFRGLADGEATVPAASDVHLYPDKKDFGLFFPGEG